MGVSLSMRAAVLLLVVLCCLAPVVLCQSDVDGLKTDPSRTLLQTAEPQQRTPGGLVGNIGSGLFVLIFFGILSIIGCIAADTRAYPGVIRFGIAFLYFGLLIILLALPKKR